MDLIELELEDLDKQLVWHPYTQMKDWIRFSNRVIVRGEGFWLIDSRGKKYLDGSASMWCNVWGHGRNEIVDSIIRQIQELQHSTLFGLANKPSIKLAQKLIKLAPGMDKVFYSDNGSTAMEVAMKMATQYWRNKGKPQKKRFISLENGYHGDTIGTMSVGFIRKFFDAYRPLLMKVHRAPNPFVINKIKPSVHHTDVLDDCLEKTEDILKKNCSECSAFIMESGAQIAGGVFIYPKNYQRTISQLCKKYDVLLIVDEIATGFGRLGNMVEYIAQRSRPDFVCFGKALTAGYSPLAVTLTTNHVFNSFLGKYSDDKQFFHGHTFTGHPLGCSAALANLELYSKENLIKKIQMNSAYLQGRLKEFGLFPVVGSVRHKGLLTGIDLVIKGRPIKFMKNSQNVSYYISLQALKKGVFLRPLGSTLAIIPPLSIKRNALEFLINTVLELIQGIGKRI